MVVASDFGGVGQYPVAGAIKELVEAGVRGQAGMVLLYTLIKRLEEDLKNAREETKDAVRDLDKWRTDYYSESRTSAVLKAQVKAAGRMKILQNALLTIGGLTTGIAIRFLVQQFSGAALAAAMCGGLLLVAGWLWPVSAKEEAE